MTIDEVSHAIETAKSRCPLYGEPCGCNHEDGPQECCDELDEIGETAIEHLQEKAAREKPEPLTLDELARAYLELCGEDNCAGDSTVGIPQCQFYKSPDWDDVNQIPIPGGCKLKSYRHKPE